MITSLENLKKDRELVNSIDWEMTPEMAVKVYLEWGNTWSRGKEGRHVVRSRKDYTVYFVVNCWDRPFYVYLIKRNADEAIELARFEMPQRFELPVCQYKGIYPVEGEIRDWLRKKLDVA